MIHYTLLPEREMQSLRREYRIRIFVVLMFFIACGIIIGIGFLMPSYILSYSQEKESLEKIQSIQKDREASGIGNYSNELSTSYDILKRLKVDQNDVVYTDLVKRVVNYKTKSLTLSSIQMTRTENASTSVEMIIQGKSSTRESLLDFKKSLEQDASVLKVELPLSDLAKNKDISYSIRIGFK